MTQPSIILTRYLYQKHNVIYSLYVSLFIREFELATFWAYELYFSGFRAETIELLITIYKTMYKDEPIREKLLKWIQKQYDAWQSDMSQDEIIATIIKNIIVREPAFESWTKFPREMIEDVAQESPQIYTQRPIFIKIPVEDIAPYRTKIAGYTKGWKMLREVCIYKSWQDPEFPKLSIRDYDNWLYYATGTPIWRTYIKKHSGKINDNKKMVDFPSEDATDEFYNWFNLEPDEQPKSVQECILGVAL